MIKAVPFEIRHIDMLNARNFDADALRWVERADLANGNWEDAASLFLDDEIVAMIGVHPQWPGVGVLWCLTGNLVDKHPAAFIRAIRALQTDFLSSRKYHRLQAAVHCGHIKGQRWAEWSGMKLEAVMQAYGPDRADYFLYAMVDE